MEWAAEDMRAAQDDAHALLDATMRLHLAIARASHIDVLIGMYQTIVISLTSTMTKASFVPPGLVRGRPGPIPGRGSGIPDALHPATVTGVECP
jgi:hypothetical protein